jgi:demethylmenaquinone methyltransferase/2-methoxy-6-polyprenyl-1,4-benzoquinol methylase
VKDPAEIRSMFASVSRRYDFLNHLLSLNQDKRWRRKTVEMSGLRPGGLALDVCTGTADLALAYSEHAGSSGLVVGTDFCPEMLHLGKKKARSESAGRGPCLMVADTLALPFPDNVFDVVSVAFGIRNVADVERGIQQMTRVAKTGGRVVILEFSMPDNSVLNAAYRMYFTRVLPLIGRTVSRSGNNAYTYLPDSVLKFPQGSAMRGIMERCGLEKVSVTELTFGIVTLYIGIKPGTEE